MKNIALIFLTFLFACNSNNGNSDFLEKQTKENLLEIESKKFRNYELLNEFEKTYIINPDKTRPFYKQAKKVHERTFAVNETIEKVTNSDSLFLAIEKYTDWFNSTFIDQKNFIHEQTEFIARQNEQFLKNNLDSKEELNYLITKLNGKILDLEYETLTYIYKIISEDDFEFNKLEPVFILDNPKTKRGELFTARIGLAAIDTTKYGEVFINHKNEKHRIEVIDGFGIYRSETKYNKTYNIEGSYIYYDNKGKKFEFPFEFEFYIDE